MSALQRHSLVAQVQAKHHDLMKGCDDALFWVALFLCAVVLICLVSVFFNVFVVVLVTW